jgi:hypothetical protein
MEGLRNFEFTALVYLEIQEIRRTQRESLIQLYLRKCDKIKHKLITIPLGFPDRTFLYIIQS